ncbi:hypothetical protein BDQ12DRAFT_684687 [Crucibulum laeve]|uniref:Uncharacterized protein n=1 Tax=Crucibulum laeve TaxID=68775 RepID=A0A5C3LXB9_9AGAR|nr:hypothetical protein BDQ12DRAFT_684687 [Crucibulum laeve]
MLPCDLRGEISLDEDLVVPKTMFPYYLYFQDGSAKKRVGRTELVLCKCISFMELSYRNSFTVECSFNEVRFGLAV